MFRRILTSLFIGLLIFGAKSSQAFFWKEDYFKKVIDRAEKMAGEPFNDPAKNQLPPELAAIGYDQWRDFRYRPDQALWKNSDTPFQIQFFHMGFLFKWPVKINTIDNKRVNTVAFSPKLFDYGSTGLQDSIPPEFSFSGFRVHYPLNTPDYWDELIAFLGASYFRAVSQGQAYGLSARGLAVNTGTSSGEEFPFFKEFWIERPRKGSDTIVIHALLDSPSVSGALSFTIQPGAQTRMDVHSVFFARKNIEKVGIAPLTSMYSYGENQTIDNHLDFRPEVHDSDGLLIHSSDGEWIWRPLMNPERLLVNSFNGHDVRGFGLLQRDRNFDHYQDLEARYDIRPSVWVEPKGQWGAGQVELLQIPSPNEYNDNMNAYWIPEQPWKAGERAEFEYTLHWCNSSPNQLPLGYVTDTRMMRENKNEKILFVLEFDGEKFNTLAEDTHLYPEISVAGGYNLIHQQLIKNMVTGGWRLVFRIERGQRDILKDMIPSQRPTVDLRAVLKTDTEPVTETWVYSFFP